MKIFVILLVLVVADATLAARKRREADELTGLETDALGTLCVLSCLEQHQRKGVEGPLWKPSPLESGCDSLDLRELVDMCKAYNQAGNCLSNCPTSSSKSTIVDGLQHICTEKFEAFQKYIPCFNQQCPTIEEQCAEPCGALDEFQNELYSQITDNETETEHHNGLSISLLGRRKREKTPVGTSTPVSKALAGDKTTPDPPDYTDPPVPEGIDLEGARTGFLSVCKYLGCYVSCSRPTLVKQCGQEAHELLEYTARMLFSIVLTPFRESFFTSTNISQMMSDGCSDLRFVPQAHKHTSAASISVAQGFFTLAFITVITGLIKLIRY